MTAGGGLISNLLLARWLSPDAYGAFAVAFASFLFVAGFHNVLLVEPMTVLGPARYEHRLREYLGAKLRAHFVVVGPLAILLFAGGAAAEIWSPASPMGGAIVGGAIALPFLLLHWLGRRMCYVLQQPARAVLSSAVYFVFSVASLMALMRTHLLSPLTALVVMGLSGLVASLFVPRLAETLLSARDQTQVVNWAETLRQDWLYGRWLAGSAALSWIAYQAQTLLVAGFLGLDAAGALRAMQLPSLVMAHVIVATSLLVLPSLAYERGRGNFKRLQSMANITSACLGLLALGYAGMLIAIAAVAEHALFGGKYADYAWLIPLLAAVPISNGFASGYSMTLRALEGTDVEFKAYAAAAAVSLFSGVLLIQRWNIVGAAFSSVLSAATLAVATYGCWRRLELRHGGIENLVDRLPKDL